jgi:hypothetical protein
MMKPSDTLLLLRWVTLDEQKGASLGDANMTPFRADPEFEARGFNALVEFEGGTQQPSISSNASVVTGASQSFASTIRLHQPTHVCMTASPDEIANVLALPQTDVDSTLVTQLMQGSLNEGVAVILQYAK